MKRKKINSHLTLEGRLFIEEGLNNGTSVTVIAKKLSRDRSNIGTEILKHRILKLPNLYDSTSCCIHKDTCKNRKYNCDSNCNRFVLDICEKLKASPHVCNGCSTRSCRKAKYYYNANEANSQYLEKLSSSRKNLHYSEVELNVLNNDLYCLVIINKSLYHSLSILNSEGFNFKLKTIYRQIKDGRLKLKSSDLPRANRKKLIKQIDKTYKRDIKGHTHEDYEEKIKTTPTIIQWQMDCVQGIVGKKEQVFLTLQIVEIKFLFIFPLKEQTNKEVIRVLNWFISILKEDENNILIELLLTDNGHEFINLQSLIDVLGHDNIYYCHPYSSYEKGSIENNHELIRRIIPKGVSLFIYNENDIKLLCSHINSLFREQLDGKCPFDLINQYLSKKTISKLGYKKINPRDVKLIPELLGDKNVLNIKKYLDQNEIKSANVKFLNN